MGSEIKSSAHGQLCERFIVETIDKVWRGAQVLDWFPRHDERLVARLFVGLRPGE